MSQVSAKSPIVSVRQTPARLKHVVCLAFALSLPWSLGACASNTAPKDTGQRLSERGSEIGAYGTAWSDGNKNVQKGQQSVEKSTRSLAEGERDLARARADLAKAEQQISDATAAKAVRPEADRGWQVADDASRSGLRGDKGRTVSCHSGN